METFFGNCSLFYYKIPKLPSLWKLMEHIQLKLALSTSFTHRKRCFADTFSDTKRILPLFLVGWPPVKSRRECTAANYISIENGGGGGGSNAMYVKVEMEGIGIARKLDLSIYHSYQSLLSILLPMFGKSQENVEMYKLTYQDKEGDWLLAGDVPWGDFIESVRRLKLLRTEFDSFGIGEANFHSD